MSDEDEVGYKKPPRKYRFSKGTSGNPRGRAKGSKNLATLLTDALDERVRVTENGRRRTRSKRELIIAQLTNRSATGELKAIAMILALMAQIEARGQTQAAPENEVADPDDEAVIAAFLARNGLEPPK